MLGAPLLLGDDGYNISRSVRLRSSASAYFNRTPAGAGTSNKTFVYSGWVKRGSLGSIQNLISSPNTGNSDSLRFSSADKLEYIWQDTSLGQVTTTQVFRDPSAWYHIVFAMDTTQATASNRFKLYVNGVQVTAFDTASYPAQNTVVNNTAAVATKLGQYANSSAQSFDGYLTEINFIDGQALTPSSFGETDAVTGVWQPKKYAGTYGTNGFYLNFADNSAATAAAIGKDSSGNGNNWTPNNISVTAGVTYDSMIDVPTMWADGGNGRGNYATWNPIDNAAGSTVTNANLNLSVPSVAGNTRATFAPSSGKWYWESTFTSNANAGRSGVQPTTAGAAGVSTTGYGLDHTNGQKIINGTSSAYGSAISNNDVVMYALDLDAGKVWIGKNGTWFNSGNPAAGTNELSSGLSGNFTASQSGGGGVSMVSNTTFGQRPFAYTPPTGFKALNTQNLPDATIKKGNQYFDVSLYTGNGSNQTITNAGFQPDLFWGKSRSAVNNHGLVDSVRGGYAALYSNLTNAETSDGVVNSFTSNGVSLGNSATTNTNAQAYVGWQWKESVSAGFDIVTYTGTGANRTVAHSLGVAPKMVFVKGRTNSTDGFIVWHTSIAATQYLDLRLTSAASTAATVWNSTAPSSSVFSVGTATGTNANGVNYVAYLFAEVAGFSKFGSYTGNSSADGPFVYCGFRPKFVMVKRSDTVSNWVMWDSSRNLYNETNAVLYPHLSQAEDNPSTNRTVDFLSNGFKLRQTGGDVNGSGGTHIFVAFAENPFKNSLAR